MNVYIILIMTFPWVEMCNRVIIVSNNTNITYDVIHEPCEKPLPKVAQETSCEGFNEHFVDDIINSNGVFIYNNTRKMDLKDMLQTNCRICDDKLKEFFKRAVKCSLKQTPEKTKEIMKVYDPDGLYVVDHPDSEPK